MSSDLAEKMRALADRIGGTVADDLRQEADAFDAAFRAHYGRAGGLDTARTLLGAWARARRAYRAVSGDRMI